MRPAEVMERVDERLLPGGCDGDPALCGEWHVLPARAALRAWM